MSIYCVWCGKIKVTSGVSIKHQSKDNKLISTVYLWFFLEHWFLLGAPCRGPGEEGGGLGVTLRDVPRPVADALHHVKHGPLLAGLQVALAHLALAEGLLTRTLGKSLQT